MSKHKIFEWTAQWLKTQSLPHISLEQVNSTQSYSKEINLPHLHLTIAQGQKYGQGRKHNKWLDSDFMGSFAWTQHNPPPFILSCLGGMYLYQSLRKIFPSLNLSIKAPNDIYIKDKKVAGLLVEVIHAPTPQILVGIGINVFQSPNLEASYKSTHINSYVLVTQQIWEQFLSNLWQCMLALTQTKQSYLQDEDIDILTIALKNHPSQEQLTSVTSDGSLVFKDRTQSWDQL